MARVSDDGPLLAFPERLDARRYKQSPHPHDSPPRKGAETSPLVWVKVTRSGELTPSEGSNNEGSYWWPARVRKFKNLYFRPNADLRTGYRGTVDYRTSHRLSLWGNFARCRKERPHRGTLSIPRPHLQEVRPGYHALQLIHV